MSVAKTWGSTPEERARPFACDDLIPNADAIYFRAVDFAGPPSVMFRWLCQLRAAPYSYDWVDNGGRRSPRELTPGLEQLEVGCGFLNWQVLRRTGTSRLCWTFRARNGGFGEVAVTYAVRPGRLVAKLRVDTATG